MEVLGRRLVAALAENSDLLDLAQQVATALEDPTIGNRGDALKAEHKAPGAGHVSPTFDSPPTRA